MGEAFDHPPLLPSPSAPALRQSAGVHEDVFTQRVGIACGKSHRDPRREGHLEEKLHNITQAFKVYIFFHLYTEPNLLFDIRSLDHQ